MRERLAGCRTMKNIYIGNLDSAVTENEVRDLFQEHGKVETVTLVKDRDSGHPRGFAFVEMANDGEAEAAIVALNGTVLRERPLSVNEARPKHADHNGKISSERRKSRRDTLTTRTHRQHRY